MVMSFREGAVEFGRFRTWYRRIGNAKGGAPLLVLHGGPGFPHDYLTVLDRLADQREVIFYDQLGCGRSATQHPPGEWSIALFVEELANLRLRLGVERAHLFGHSWGGWLAMEYALRKSGKLTSLVLASAPASVPQFIAGIGDLIAGLSRRSRRVLNRHRAGETVDEKKFQTAYNE
ncbi:MAG: alpha/beta fold hydrolase, partial [Egibacteraceae bacterium]